MSADTPVIDLGYRPQSYFWPITHDTHVIAAIKGERRRNAIRNAFDADRVGPLDELYATPTLPDEHRLALGRLHPSFMGGEYLPDRRDTEVEIARLNIDSTTSDVTSVYARPGKDRINYRVVDEYDGDTLSEKRTRSSKRQLLRLLLIDEMNQLLDEVKQQREPEYAKRKTQAVESRSRTEPKVVADDKNRRNSEHDPKGLQVLGEFLHLFIVPQTDRLIRSP
jgi:hypothetical protein